MNKFFFNLFSETKNFYFFIVILNVSLVIDVAICTSPEFISENIKSPFGLFGFTLITVISIYGQIYLTKFTEKNDKETLFKSKYLFILSKTNKIACYILILNLIVVVLSIILFSTFSIINLLIANNISCFIGSFILGLFGLKFILWFKERKNSYNLLFYGLGFIFFSFCNFIIFMSDTFLLIEKPLLITSNMPIIYPDIDDNIFDMLTNYWSYLQTISFIMLLIASYLLLYHYTEKINKYKLIFGLVLVFIVYMSTNLNTFHIMEISIHEEDLFYYYIFQSLINTLGGIIFGYSFWKVANKLDKNNPIRRFLIISANGIILIYTVTQATVIATAFPPYGISSLSFIIVSIYLLNFGLYASAISLSNDIQLRGKIRSLTIKNTSLLGNIGQAHMTGELQKAIDNVKHIVKKEEQELEEKTGIESSFTEEKVQDYMEQVIQEVMSARMKKNNPNI